jgi:hypothetical protein
MPLPGTVHVPPLPLPLAGVIELDQLAEFAMLAGTS